MKTIHSLTKFVTQFPSWSGAEEIHVSVLGGGLTNKNFLVEADGESYVVRLPGENTKQLGINRQHEYAAHKAAANAGIAPPIISFSEPAKVLITRFIPGSPITTEEMGSREMIKKVAKLLKQVHWLPAIPATFSPFRVVERYAKIAEGFGVEMPASFPNWLSQAKEIEHALRKFTPVLCHNDLLSGNFLQEDSKVWLLDWEYAGMGNPLFDLANFSTHHEFNDEQEDWLLEAYFGIYSHIHRERLSIMKFMSDFREAMWGMAQIGLSQLDFDYRDYAEKYFARMAMELDDKVKG